MAKKGVIKGVKDAFNRKITITSLQRNYIIIITMLSTLLLLNFWPRFLNDVLNFPMVGYITLLVVFSILLYRGWKK